EGTEKIPYGVYFERMGFDWQPDEETAKEPKIQLGIELKDQVISLVKRDSAADRAGLNVHDKIIALNRMVIENLEEWLSHRQAGEIVRFQVIRNGLLIEVPVTLELDQTFLHKATKIEERRPEQVNAYQKWLQDSLKHKFISAVTKK
ncbi:MAG: PDZ domain-containing protein, partial [Bacteroidia bacterium]|nr:PDZ domain-containing protein [Bacteroidia bacterium]